MSLFRLIDKALDKISEVKQEMVEKQGEYTEDENERAIKLRLFYFFFSS